MALQRAVYRPRNAEHTVLHQVIAEHLEVFLRTVAAAGDGAGLPQFVECEFREFLTCGVFEHGVAVIRKILAHLPSATPGRVPASPHASLAPPHPDRLLESAADAVVPSRLDVAARLTRRCVSHSMPLTRAGSLDPRGGHSCALWQGLLGRPASESGRLRRGGGRMDRATAAGARSC